MNLRDASNSMRRLVFPTLRAIASVLPGGRVAAFGSGEHAISSILIVNLDRQPRRWQRVLRELRRFRTGEGASLASLATRFPAVDARDGRAVAASVDVDTLYRMGDQLYVQPDPRLEECFGKDELIKMTRPEVAIARSHVEVWKAIATGPNRYVLVLEDDVWFRRGAAVTIDAGWRAALKRCETKGGPRLLYLSYADAGGTAERADACNLLFRPVRGLWFLSGYVLSREGAADLLRAMPVVGPVDLWINYRFEELGALALASPVIEQRPDGLSDNSYSILPYLARAGVVDAVAVLPAPDRSRAGPVLAWTNPGEREWLAMALSMLGLRVRAFDGDEDSNGLDDLLNLFEVFDALIDVPLASRTLNDLIETTDAKFIIEQGAALGPEMPAEGLPPHRTAVLEEGEPNTDLWDRLCALLALTKPPHSFPVGAPRSFRMFRDDRPAKTPRTAANVRRSQSPMDDSPWVVPLREPWRSIAPPNRTVSPAGSLLVRATMTTPTSTFRELVETFPGNQASFARDGMICDQDGTHLVIRHASTGTRPYRSGAFASVESFQCGRFEAEIRAAAGSGLITGFFLHRSAPRQEIDIEIAGSDPRRMLVNVYFNPGDDGAEISFGYRGTPCRIELGFDATQDFHLYSIDWRPGHIAWSVDGIILHERVGWDPTPIPHLPMRLHANLWAPRSEELAGPLAVDNLPARASFRNISVRSWTETCICDVA